MANTILLKRSGTTGHIPSSLSTGEIAVNTYDGTIYLGINNGTASVKEVGAVYSVAGRTGVVTLTNADISGLGTMSTQAASAVSITGGTAVLTSLQTSSGATGSITQALGSTKSATYSTGVTPSATNYSLAFSATDTYLSAPTTAHIQVGGSDFLTCATYTNSDSVSGKKTSVNLTTASATGNTGIDQFCIGPVTNTTGTGEQGWIFTNWPASGGNYAALYNGGVAPGYTNHALVTSATATQLNAYTTVGLLIQNVSVLNVTSAAVTIYQALSVYASVNLGTTTPVAASIQKIVCTGSNSGTSGGVTLQFVNNDPSGTPSNTLMSLGNYSACLGAASTAYDARPTIWSTVPVVFVAGIAGSTSGVTPVAGQVGEVLTATGSLVVMTTSGTSYTIVSLALTAGDWDVMGAFISAPTGVTTTTKGSAGISTTAATLPASPMYSAFQAAAAGVAVGNEVPTTRVLVSATTTVYLVANFTFAVSTMKGTGTITARRRQ